MAYIPSDPLFGNQWYLQNTGQFDGVAGIDINVTTVWDDYTGSGIRIGVYDTGLEYTHHDLDDNYDATRHLVFNLTPHDPFPLTDLDYHGTSSAGVIAAENNNIGTVGVAFDASLTGFNIEYSNLLYLALGQQDTFDVTNHSYGSIEPFADSVLDPFSFFYGFNEGLADAVTNGRGGLGTNIVHSAGNQRHAGDGGARDGNASNFTNSRFVTSVAALSDDGFVTFFSTPGAAVLVSAPTDSSEDPLEPGTAGVWTTDRLGQNGENSGSDFFDADNSFLDYTGNYGGTSAAAPMVTGVVALMLEANPDLGWRDVQEILSYSSRHVGTAVGSGHGGHELYDWSFNGAENWNGGGLHFSNDYGFGLVDALAVVRLAETWTVQSTLANEASFRMSSDVDVAIPDNNASGITYAFYVNREIDIEHVEVTIDMARPHGFAGDLVITVTSPDGTTSHLLNRLGQVSGEGEFGEDQGLFIDFNDWKLSSNAFRGESSTGNWLINVSDHVAGFTGTVGGVTLEIFGSSSVDDDTYVYTNEYSNYAGLFGHSTTLSDPDGGIDAINAAAVTGSSTINLNAGTTSVIDGTPLTIEAGRTSDGLTIVDGSAIENAYGGDGDDLIIGNSAWNHLFGGRGSDVLEGGLGNDYLEGGNGDDTLVGGAGDDELYAGSGNDVVDGGEGDDLIVGGNGAGNDAYRGGAGIDTVRYTSAVRSIAVNLTLGSASGADIGQDTLGQIENVIGGSGNDALTGDANANVLIGGDGADLLNGAAGNDTLDGGSGADTMEGGSGDDTYVVDNAGDVVTEGGGTAYAPPAGFTIKGTVDLDNDGDLDVLIWNASTNATQLQTLQNGVAVSTIGLPSWSGWPVQGLVDVNGDGKKDVLYQGSTSQWVIPLNGTVFGDGFATSGRTPNAILPLPAGNEGIDTVRSGISYTLGNGVENLTLTGTGNINGTGNALANVIIGNSGDNVINGKGGLDTLTGNAGIDTFGFAAGETGSMVGTRDLITDFTPGTDKLDISALGAFRFLGTAAFDGTANALRYFYDASRGVTVVEGDIDGNGVADFGIELSGNKTLTTADFTSGSLLLPLNLTGTSGVDTMVGGALGDTLSGLGANDTLRGLAGNDTLDGGSGADTMEGGLGDDTYVVDDAGDVVTEVGGAVYAPPAGFTIKGTADLDGDGDLDVLIWNATTNATQLQTLQNGVAVSTIVLPSWSGWPVQGLVDVNGDGKRDVLYQSGTSQWVIPLNGTVAGSGFGTSGRTPDAILPLPAGNEGTDTVRSGISYTLGNGVENLTLTGTGNINGTGNAVANVIVGNSGNNIINGRGGADTLTGNAGGDTFAFAAGETGVTVGTRDLVTDFTPGTDKLDISALGAFRFLGTAAFDGAANALRTFYDAARNVTVVEGDIDGNGIANFGIELSGNKALTTADFTSGSLLLPLNLTGTGGADKLVGGALNDTLSGLGGNDTLRGMAGNDTLDGGTGADTMEGGLGDDTYVVDDAGDVVTEVGGAVYAPPAGFTIKGTADLDGDGDLDVLIWNATTNATQLQTLQNGVAVSTIVLPSWSGWPVQGLVDVNGDGKRDVLYQSGTSQWVIPLNGTVAGSGFGTSGRTPDAILPLPAGNEGTDTVRSGISYTLGNGVENLTLTGTGNINGTGNAVANVIVGNSGNNIINGRGGADTLTGNAGGDTFAFAAGETGVTVGTRDLVTDFTPGTDKLDISALGAFRFLGTAAFDGAANALRTFYDAARNVTVVEGDIDGNGIANFGIELSGNKALTTADFTSGSLLLPLNLTGTGGADKLVGGALNDTLSGLGGNDTLRGMAGNDTLDGGTGADTMEGGQGDDIYVVDDAGDMVTEVGGAAYTPPAGFTIKGTADLDGDGDLDVLIWNASTNATQLQTLQNGVAVSTKVLPSWSGWQVQGLVDVNGDGKKDVLYQSGSSQWVIPLNGTETGDGFATSGRTPDAILPLPSGNAGTDLVQASISYVLPNGVENLTLTGTGDINGTGNASDNVIVGNSGNNIISGRAGVDTLTGNAGADAFSFEAFGNGLATITDFAHGVDILEISAAGFGGGLTAGGPVTLVTAGSASAASNPGTSGYFIFDDTGTGAGTVFWDPTGGSGADAIALAELQNVNSLLPSDFHLV